MANPDSTKLKELIQYAKKSFAGITLNVPYFQEKVNAEILNMPDHLCPDSESMYRDLWKQQGGL